jgi:hypothetical protein
MRIVSTFVVAIVMLIHTPPMSAAFAEQSQKDKIVGTWKVISWESRRPNGQIVNIWANRPDRLPTERLYSR